MRSIKIIQCGDIHFDTPFKDLPKDISKLRRAELKESFSKIIDKSLEQQIDLFLLTGDMFDNFSIEKNTLIFIREELKRLNNIPVFIVTGNHDPYNSKSFYSMIKWSNNVHIFGDNVTYVELPNLNTVVYGASFTNKYCKKSKLKNFNLKSNHKNMIKLMLMHGEIVNSTEGDYNPITLNEISNSHMDYIAMGHSHKFSGINRAGNTYYAYSGCPEGRGFDECGDKGVIFGEINKGFCNLKFQPINKRKYTNLEIFINECLTNKDIKDKIIKSIPIHIREKDLFSITLKGEISEDLNICIKTLENILKKYFFYIKIKDKTNIKIDIESISKENSLRGVFYTKMLNKIDNAENEEEQELLKLALRIGIKSILEQEVNLNDN
ncbi:metallophosphoesterase family protein [Clostridium tarantellae]|uniref:DNA repair exonuclease n=1 Tax=Clostridium tarantellae TaxID=39493 RepID=A0A6I1MLL2_9CLOT|nr:metallophosphoesterase [Clostridium tarantellae]MPQ44305.1 DNA repair exonuclease [Clostridium tarantellae]